MRIWGETYISTHYFEFVPNASVFVLFVDQVSKKNTLIIVRKIVLKIIFQLAVNDEWIILGFCLANIVEELRVDMLVIEAKSY